MRSNNITFADKYEMTFIFHKEQKPSILMSTFLFPFKLTQ